METFPIESIDECANMLSLIKGIGDARIRFHLHCVCASACKLQHVVKLIPPSVTSALAQRLDDKQNQYYSQSNNAPMTAAARRHAALKT